MQGLYLSQRGMVASRCLGCFSVWRSVFGCLLSSSAIPLYQGGCLQPLLDNLIPKKKNGSTIEAALSVIIEFLDTPVVEMESEEQKSPNAMYIFEQVSRAGIKRRFDIKMRYCERFCCPLPNIC